MQRSASAKRHVGKEPGVVAFFNGDQANGARHFGVRQREDGFGRLVDIEPQGLGHTQLDRLARQLHTQGLQAPAPQRAVRRDAPEQHIGIGDGCSLVTSPIARRPRVGAR